VRLAVEDYIEIQQLYARYAFALDLEDVEAFVATWAPDGEYVGSVSDVPKAKGLEAIRAFASEAMARQKGYHWNSNLVIEATEDGATGQCYLLYVLAGERGSGRIRDALYYRDELVRHDGRWLFRRRNSRSL
jgi:uncharacterized protein (TIGR02246 family)